jgi:isocitrate/isopropylmalate dehydrogenase
VSVAEDVAKAFPDITLEQQLLDRVCLAIVQDPRDFNQTVMVTLTYARYF